METLLPQTRTPVIYREKREPQIYDLNILETIHSACPATANIQRPQENTGSILEHSIAGVACTTTEDLKTHQDSPMASCCLSFSYVSLPFKDMWVTTISFLLQR